jgi:hypothetical protein
MAARSEHGRRRPVGGGRVQRAAVTPEVASRALPRQQPAAAAAPAAEWGAAAATPARSGSHLRRRCQNGFSSSRGGFQSRWHSLVNCDYGDSTTSRFDSPAAAVSWRGAGWGSVEGEHRGGARAPLDGSLWPTPMPGAAQERVMAPSPRSTAPRRRPATRRRSASGTAQPRPCADGARRLVLVPPLPHRSTSVSGVRPIHRTPPDLVVGTVLNPHGGHHHTPFSSAAALVCSSAASACSSLIELASWRACTPWRSQRSKGLGPKGAGWSALKRGGGRACASSSARSSTAWSA